MPQDSSIMSKLAALNAAYAEKLPTKIAQIEESIGSLQEVANLAHKLSGSAGTHGFHSLGRVAKELELTCLDLLRHQTLPSTKDKQFIQQFIVKLRQLDSEGLNNTHAEENTRLDSMEAALQLTTSLNEKGIIIVDDDIEQSNMLGQLLTNFGFSVTLLEHPSLLEEAINLQPPMAVIMDIAFADGNNTGLKFTQQLRQQNVLNCPVIFISVRDDFQARLEAIRGGSNGYIVKPVDILQLVELLNRLIETEKTQKYRVLLVDDDPEIREFCQLVLEEKGVVTRFISDPMLAVSTMIEFKPDVVILDINMPECNGFELGSTIRQMGGEFLLIPILYFTSHAEMTNRMKAAQSGSEDFMSKPIDAGLFYTSVIAKAERSKVLMELFRCMKSNEQRFSSVTRTANEAIISADQRGLILSWNKSVKTIFGYDSQEILGKPVSLLIPDKYIVAHMKGFERVLEGHLSKLLSKTVELEGLRKDGTVFPMDISISSWTSGNDRFFSATMRDITQRKKIEEELLEAKIEADRANQAKSDFLNNMSHELRTPLNAVIGFSQLLMLTSAKSPLNDKQYNNVNEILKGGRHLLELVNEILDLAKIEAGSIRLSMEPVDLNAVLLECVSIVTVLAEKKGINIKLANEGVAYLREQDELPTQVVYADHTRLKQVLLNLLTNAIKYNVTNGSIQVNTLAQSSHETHIEIVDTGEGLDESQIESLFQPFNRLGVEGSEIEGTGIGLVITKNLVELMGGKIGVESPPNEGCTFWVDLTNEKLTIPPNLNPLRQQNSEPDFVSPALEKPQNEQCFLYIEDNPVNLRLVEKIIQDKATIRFYSAHEPFLGLAMAKEKLPQFILLDMQLLAMDGYEVLKKIREDNATKHIPIVALSANSSVSDIKKGLEAGFDAYLTKPIDIDTLLNTVKYFSR